MGDPGGDNVAALAKLAASIPRTRFAMVLLFSGDSTGDNACGIALSNLNFENRVTIRMHVAPSEVFISLDNRCSRELTILTVLLSQVDAVSMILVAVPHMIVFALPIVISLVVIRLQRHRCNQGGEQ
jgi:hypothetical protein